MKRLPMLLIPLLLLSFKAKEKRSTIEVTTDYGTMKIMLYNETPLHRDNMLKLVQQHFYDSLMFHRVIKDFMIQGGDPESKHAQPGQMLGSGSAPGDRIPAEFKPELFHKKGVLAAARDNNPEKASSNCQFYIVQGKKYTDDELNQMEQRTGVKYTPEQREAYKTIGGTPFLDQNYTVYGEVYEGLNVLDSIAAVKTDSRDRPLKDVRMFMKVGKPVKVK
ncbi:MAG: peptidylprolyl isomerase [Chitinophagales bacterium]|nr:peptidylprolyl isomerase [Chitinophagales bacterium]